MADKDGKSFSLRQRKSKRVPISGPQQISGPINTTSQQPASSRGPPTRPTLNGRSESATQNANTSDLVKRRYSTRFINPPEFSNANAPPIPSMPSLPNGYGGGGGAANARPSNADRSGSHSHKIPVDINALKDPRLQVEKYSTKLLADASDQELQDYQASLRKIKNRASADLQQNVYQNRAQFIKISKEAEKLKGEMRTLRGLMSELTTSLSQASITAGAPEPTRAPLDEGARSRARKQANRSSVANLEAMWNVQLHALWKNVEGSQKFLPAIPGRHIVLEQGAWLELDAATWKARRHAHMFLLNDHIMIATRRKKRVDPNAMNADASQKNTTRLVADKCWPLQDIDMVDLASMSGAGAGGRDGMSNAISVRHGQESFTYRSDKSSNSEKMNLLLEFRRTADELRRALRAGMEENSNKSKDTMDYLTARDPALSKNEDLLQSLGAKDRPEILIEVEGKHQNLRWVEGQIDDLDSEVALHRFEDAVRHVEKLRRLAKGLKGNMIAQDLITTKVDERARKLAGEVPSAVHDCSMPLY